MYCGGKNQEPKLQQSSKTGRKNMKNATKLHSKQGEYVRKNQNIVVLQAPHPCGAWKSQKCKISF